MSEAAAGSAGNGRARLDQWLWAVRLFRTRALAASACRQGRVTVATREAKPARAVTPGQVVTVRDGLLIRTFRVEGLPPSRVGARRVPEFRADLTPPPEPGTPAPRGIAQILARARDEDRGRPTKKARRDFLRFFP